MPEFFAELMGKRTGLSQGKAGSMHLASPAQGIMGSSAIVGSTIPHAVGSALASKIRGITGRVHIAVFGDGAMEQGVFHESLNFTSIHKLPVIFLCEDNGLAVHTDLNTRQSFDVCSLVNSFGIPVFDIEEGYDPYIVASKSESVIQDVRMTGRPAFVRIHTRRYKEHVGPGEDFDAGYRSKADIDTWKKKDPLMSNSAGLLEYAQLIHTEIADALEFALNSPLPTSGDLLTDVI